MEIKALQWGSKSDGILISSLIKEKPTITFLYSSSSVSHTAVYITCSKPAFGSGQEKEEFLQWHYKTKICPKITGKNVNNILISEGKVTAPTGLTWYCTVRLLSNQTIKRVTIPEVTLPRTLLTHTNRSWSSMHPPAMFTCKMSSSHHLQTLSLLLKTLFHCFSPLALTNTALQPIWNYL